MELKSFDLPISEYDLKALNSMFSSVTQSSYVFWFEAIVNRAIHGERVISFNELIEDMMRSAWGMVRDYHIEFSSYKWGEVNTLVKLVNCIEEQLVQKEKAVTIDNMVNELNGFNGIIRALKGAIIDRLPYDFLVSVFGY